MKSKTKVIFWDFDGVLINSNNIRDLGFEKVLVQYPKEQVDKLMHFHRKNGGLSRYVKFRYFFEDVRNEAVTEYEIAIWAERFSVIMKSLLSNTNLLIKETLNFVKENQENYIMHITSGSDQNELRYLCESLEINHLFTSIHGSPTPKKQLIQELISSNSYNTKECIIIGDSINDYEAAQFNSISFMSYNNDSLNKFTTLKLF